MPAFPTGFSFGFMQSIFIVGPHVSGTVPWGRGSTHAFWSLGPSEYGRLQPSPVDGRAQKRTNGGLLLYTYVFKVLRQANN